MTTAVEQLVRETIELTGADGPALLESDAPLLSDVALASGSAGDDGFYLVGLIGGKEVGKSALVNALVGQPITAITSHGPGTEGVVAYAHAMQERPLRALLSREVPGQFRIVTHEHSYLRSQVLLDLPDIDSHFESHLQVTRSMLRHMLFPVWVQSIEKYADRQPQEMLRQVAQGNSAANFVFCLNKVDQLEGVRKDAGHEAGDTSGGVLERFRESAVLSPDGQEIGADFAGRIARTVGLSEAPEVFLISAVRPDDYDLPKLRNLLAREKSRTTVRESKQLAIDQQDRSMLLWVESQNLRQRAARLARLADDARDLLSSRVGEPVIEASIPRLLDDPANRLAMGDEVLRRRVARWPLVKLIHMLLTPLLAVWRANLGPAVKTSGLRGADALVDAYLDADGRSVAEQVKASFAQLRQIHPNELPGLYAQNHLWDDAPADTAAADLRRALASAVERQRDFAVERLAGRGGVIAPLVRWLLTIGALLWFPLIQPMLAAFLESPDIISHWRTIAAAVVKTLSGEALLKNVSFLILWFSVIWLSLRWSTQRKLARLLDRWKTSEYPDETLSLPTVALQWMQSLLAPIERGRDRTQALVVRAQALKSKAGIAA